MYRRELLQMIGSAAVAQGRTQFLSERQIAKGPQELDGWNRYADESESGGGE